MTETIATLILAALLGSLPTAYLLGRYVKGIDIRSVGSKNPGAVNAARSLGKGLGLLVLIVDAGKGALAVFIGQRLGAAEIALYLSAVLATLGHNFSPFLGFRGGKGGATVLGISALMLWQITAITVVAGAVLQPPTVDYIATHVDQVGVGSFHGRNESIAVVGLFRFVNGQTGLSH